MAVIDDDPFDWDVDRVVHELCLVDNHPWLPRVVARRPDPTALSKALRENEITGEDLMTYEDVMSSISGLLLTLGLSRPAHQMTLVRAITYLKSKSPGYRQYKANLDKQGFDSQSSSQEVVANGNRPFPGNHAPGSPTRDVKMDGSEGQAQVTAMGPQDEHPPSKAVTQVGHQKLHDAELMASPAPNFDHDNSGGPPQKKRRVAPALISTDFTGAGASRIPSAADGITLHFPAKPKTQARSNDASPSNDLSNPESDRRPKPEWVDETPNAYFGHEGMITAEWVPKSNFPPTTDQPTTPRGPFYLTTAGLVPPGRRLQIHRATRRLFLTNNQSLSILGDGVAPYVEPDEDDRVLPLFGDSDSEEGYDSETMEAIIEEEEAIRQEQEMKSLLSAEDVDRVMQQEIARMEAAWEERKLPSNARKARAIWNQARRQGRTQHIAQATSRLDQLNTRIDSLCKEIRKNEWPKEEQLKMQLRILEASVEDRKGYRWRLDVLRGPEPPGPETMPKLRAILVQRDVISDEDGEVIISDDDDYGFVIDDTKDATYSPEPPEIQRADPMDLDKPEQLAELVHPSVPAPSNELAAKILAVSQATGTVIDLTGADSEPASEKVINLVTPTKPKAVRGARQSTEVDEEQSFSDEELDIPYYQPDKIAAIPLKIWKGRQDRERLLISVLWSMDERQRKAFFHIIKTMEHGEVWSETLQPALSATEGHSSDAQDPTRELGFVTARLFRVFCFCKIPAHGTPFAKEVRRSRSKKILDHAAAFEEFHEFVRENVIPHFTDGDDGRELGSEEPNIETDNSERYTDDGIEATPSKKRKRIIILDQTAKDLRENDQQRLQEQERRRKDLRKKLAASDNISSDKSRLIINETKQEYQGLVYVNEEIGKRIKNHQIDGVRFMWNQIIGDSKARQGCLLAHTMGLGKTMQVITLLVAIAEAAQSGDDSIRSQIPKDLRQSKTLVLCPAPLVDNWIDELLIWAPDGLLGQFFKLEAAVKAEERGPLIRHWDNEGGIMVIGYNMFKQMIGRPDEELPNQSDAKTVSEILIKSPNIVVADEAHKLKNPESKVAMATGQFRTQSRIALTGSPLANNVEEFYHMIDWVAPQYLGPPAEFKEVYTDPIEAGLYEDSSASQFRKAKKQLAVLEATVAPKTHRATIKSCLKNDLPPKTEFVLTVPLTNIQALLYDSYLRSIRGEINGQTAKIFATVNNLCLIVNHPRCWQRKLMDERQALQNRASNNTSITDKIVSDGLKIMNRSIDIHTPRLSWKTQLLVAILDESEKAGDKVLVFTQSIPTLEYLESLLRQQRRNVARLDGSTPINQRQQRVKDFNAGDTQIYLISTTAGGVGLNIFGANRVVLFDSRFNPVHEQQAVGRAYRIGQQKPVYVYKLIAGGTFETSLQNRTVFKTQLASRVVDKENPKRWSKKENEYLRDREDPMQKSLSPNTGKDTVLDSLLREPELKIGIREIETTDTFFEEDIHEVLTAEDLKDVDDQVRMNGLRISNPDEFRRLEQERLNRLRATYPVPVNPPLLGAAFATAGHSLTQHSSFPGSGYQTSILPLTPRTAGNAGNRLSQHPNIDYTIAAAATSSAFPPRMSTQFPTPTVPSNAAAQEVHSDSQVSQSMGTPAVQPWASSNLEQITQSQTEHRGTPLMPMAGANTFFRNQPDNATHFGGTNISTPLNGVNQRNTETSKKFSGLRWPEQFENKILEALTKITDPKVLNEIKGNHSAVANRIARDTWRVRLDNNGAELPNYAHMKKLCSLMENPRFAALVVTEKLNPAHLGCPLTSTLEELLRDIPMLNDKQICDRLGVPGHSLNDPNHLHNVLSRSNGEPATNRNMTSRSMEDLQVLQDVAERRKHRIPRLPTWASKAVEEGRHGEPQGRVRDPFQSSPSPGSQEY